MRVLVIGPSPMRAKGGMSSVIKDIKADQTLNKEFDIEIFESYIAGNKIKVFLYTLFAFLKFCMTKSNYDIYHIHVASYGSTFRKYMYLKVAKCWKKKVILHIHGGRYMEFFQHSKQKRKIIEFLKSADMVIALSEDWKNKFQREFGLQNCRILQNGINVEHLNAAVSSCEEYQNSFAMLGRLGQRKGTYDLVGAMEYVVQKVPNSVCYLAGDGEIERVKQLIKEKKLEDNIKVLGWLDEKKKIDLLGKVSTVILPSYNEGLPMAILEGMACGKVIISTVVGAIPEVVGKQNGILIEPGDLQGLADAMIKCCNDLSFMQLISEKNMLKIKEHYSMYIMHQKLSEYYRMV